MRLRCGSLLRHPDRSQAVEAGKFDAIDAVADQWIESAGIVRMCNAIASVFEKHAPQEIMDRFRAKLADMMHLAFVEGAANGVLNARPALAALASAPADRSAAYDRLERHLDENYYAGARDDLRQVASAPAGDGVRIVVEKLRSLMPDDFNDDDSGENYALANYAADLLARPRAAVGERMRMFLEILSAAGGHSDCSEWDGAWINAFCEGHEGQSPDTFNQAIDLGYTRSTHDSDTDHSVVYLTDAGRAILALQSPPAKVEG